MASIQSIPVSNLQPNPLQPRGIIHPESIMELVDSIKEHGVLEPLVVAHTPAGHQIIAGERRWRASKIAGLTEVPCVVKETSPKQMLEMAIVENVQREDLNPIDRAKAFKRLALEFNLSNSEVAKKVSKSPSYITNTMRLLELPDAITDGLLTGMITEGHARALQTIPEKTKMLEAYKQVLVESASVRRTEEISRDYKFEMIKKNGNIKESKKGSAHRIVVSQKVRDISKNLQDSLGRASQVKLTRSQKLTRLTISLRGTMEETDEQLNHIHEVITGKKIKQ